MRGNRAPGSRVKESREYYLKNRDRILLQTKAYAINNPEQAKRSSYLSMKKLKRENPHLYLWRHIRTRAKQKNLDFNLDVTDIVIPDVCPALGVPLNWDNNKNQRDDSPSVDRLDPSQGYIKGNINIISEKANRIKSNATSEEIRKVADWVESLVS